MCMCRTIEQAHSYRRRFLSTVFRWVYKSLLFGMSSPSGVVGVRKVVWATVSLNSAKRRTTYENAVRALKKVRDFFNAQNIGYCFFPEKHNSKGELFYHFHGLLLIPQGLDFDYKAMSYYIAHTLSVGRCNFSDVRNVGACLNYTTKYMTKDTELACEKHRLSFYSFHIKDVVLDSVDIAGYLLFRYGQVQYDFKAGAFLVKAPATTTFNIDYRLKQIADYNFACPEYNSLMSYLDRFEDYQDFRRTKWEVPDFEGRIIYDKTIVPYDLVISGYKYEPYFEQLKMENIA